MIDEHIDCIALGWFTETLVWQMNTDCIVMGLTYRNAGMTDEHRLYCRGADLQKCWYDRWTQTVLSRGWLTETLVWQMNTDCIVLGWLTETHRLYCLGLTYRNTGIIDEHRLYCLGLTYRNTSMTDEHRLYRLGLTYRNTSMTDEHRLYCLRLTYRNAGMSCGAEWRNRFQICSQ